MAEAEVEIEDRVHTTSVCFKAANGAVKQLDVVQYLDRDQVRLTNAQIREIARIVAQELRKAEGL